MWSSWLAHWSWIPEVVGSSPLGLTKLIITKINMKTYKMWLVIGRGGGVMALAKSKWKAEKIRDNEFNIGKTDLVQVDVDIYWDYAKYKTKKNALEEVKELKERINILEDILNEDHQTN